MMMKEFQDLLQLAYFEPLPKKIVVTFLLLAGVFFFTRFKGVRKQINRFFKLPIPFLLGGLLVAALLIRVFFVLSSPTYFATTWSDTRVDHDESSLMNIYSVSIASKGIAVEANGDFSMRRSLGYAYLMGFLYRFFGYSDNFFVYVQVLMGVSLVGLMFWFAYTLFEKKSIAWCAAFMMAFYPQNIISSNIFLDEYPFFLFVFATLPLVSMNIQKKSIRYTWLIGLLLGLATFCRTHALLFPVIFTIAYFWRRISMRQCVKSFLVTMSIVVLVNMPYAYQVYQHYGVFSMSPAYGSIAFYGTLNDRATWDNGYIPMSEEEGGVKEFYNEKNPVKQAQVSRQLAKKWVLENPMKTARFFIMRNLVLFGFQLSDEMTNLQQVHSVNPEKSFAYQKNDLLRKLKALAYGILAMLALGGFLVLLFDKQKKIKTIYSAVILIFLLIGYWMLIHGFFFGFRKYRWFTDLLFMPLASYFLWWISCCFKNKNFVEMRQFTNK
jgi:4-amino-4-deoxy-L-arabinose transferase-like glycosyltransferase